MKDSIYSQIVKEPKNTTVNVFESFNSSSMKVNSRHTLDLSVTNRIILDTKQKNSNLSFYLYKNYIGGSPP